MFNWDELVMVYDSMVQNCQHSTNAQTREFANNAAGMLNLIRRIRGIPVFSNTNLWIAQTALVINPLNSATQIRVWYEDDASYVIQSYSPMSDETAEIRVEAEAVADEIQHCLKVMG
jgi:hypothetical protein